MMSIMNKSLLGAAICAAAPITACTTAQHGVANAPVDAQQILRAGTQAPTIGSVDRFTGHVRVEPLFTVSEDIDASGAYVTFEPGARSAWHTHPAGQRLVVTSGVGLTQEWGKPVQEIQTGDVIVCPPGIKHWHGAAPSSALTHLAVTGSLNGKSVLWMERVTDEEYGAAAATATPGTSTAAPHTDPQLVTSPNTSAPSPDAEKLVSISRQKWLWMAERKVEALANLFHDEAVFVHMGGTMSKRQELDVIEKGTIHYKHAEIDETSVRFIGATAILISKLRLDAVVGGNEVSNPFTVTEVYVRHGASWMLAAMSFTRLLGQ